MHRPSLTAAVPIPSPLHDPPVPPAYRPTAPADGADARAEGAPEAPSPGGGRTIPTEVSATWELELLIAGAVTFALFQLPGSLDAALAWLEPRVSGATQLVALCGYMYSKAIVYVLIVAFLTNLVARAYWVGLVGLNSVFPGGVRWDRLGKSVGPFATAMYKERLASLPSVIARVDNFASVVFSFAFLVVLTFVVSVVALAVFGGAAYAIAAVAFDGRHVARILAGFAALLIVPMVVAGVLDQAIGARLAPDGAGARRLRGLLRIVLYVNGTAVFGPIFLTLLTNLRRRVVVPLFYGAVIVALVAGFAEFFVRTIGLSVGGSPYLPDELDVRAVDNSHYESLRDRDGPTTVPLVQSDVITGPYVRLFIPYRADRHDPWLAAHCPGATPLRSTSLHVPNGPDDRAAADRAAERTLGCLARLHDVAIDGAPRPDLQFRFHTHPQTGRDGILTYIPTATLSAGMHVLRVQPPPRPPRARPRPAAPPWEIPIWR